MYDHCTLNPGETPNKPSNLTPILPSGFPYLGGFESYERFHGVETEESSQASFPGGNGSCELWGGGVDEGWLFLKTTCFPS